MPHGKKCHIVDKIINTANTMLTIARHYSQCLKYINSFRIIHFYEESTMMIPILQMRKWRHKEVKWPSQNLTAGMAESCLQASVLNLYIMLLLFLHEYKLRWSRYLFYIKQCNLYHSTSCIKMDHLEVMFPLKSLW